MLFIAQLYFKFAMLDGGAARWWGNVATNGYPWFVPYYLITVA